VDFLERARYWISLDTSPENGTGEAIKWISQIALAEDFQVEVQADILNGLEQSNITITPPKVSTNPSQEVFLLQSHVDTVNPGSASLWVENHMNPYNLIIKDGHLHGLGVADVKLDFLCKLEALKKFKHIEKFKRVPLLLGTYAEEIGMHGMLKFIRRNKINAKMALVGDSTNLNLVYATTGYAVVEILIPFSIDEMDYRKKNDLSESATTQTRIFRCKDLSQNNSHEENAVDKIFNYLMQIPEGVVLMDVEAGVNFNTLPQHGILEIDLVSGVRDTMVQKLRSLYYEIIEMRTQFLMHQDADFNPSNPTIHIGMIKTYSGHISVSVFCRFPPVITEEQYQLWLKKLGDISTKVSGQARVTDYKRPYRTDIQSAFALDCQKILSSMELSVECKTQANTNEAGLLSRTGIDCLIFGAGVRDGNVHTPQEKVKIDDVYKAIEFYSQAIERFCL
jgi:succinyl-diaminopimelate desuccinylase